MAKTASQGFFVEKGEKLGLGIAAGIGVLFLIFGIMAIGGRSQDPEAYAKAVDTKAAQLNNDMASNKASIPDISEPIKKPQSKTPVPSDPTKVALFDPTTLPDGRR